MMVTLLLLEETPTVDGYEVNSYSKAWWFELSGNQRSSFENHALYSEEVKTVMELLMLLVAINSDFHRKTVGFTNRS